MEQTPDLSVTLGGVTFANPIMPASGCFNFGKEFAHALDLAHLGAILNKTVLPKPREGNPPERVAEVRAGMLNSIGIPGKGPGNFIHSQLPFMRSVGTRVIVSIGGLGSGDFAEMAEIMEEQDGIDGFELDLSCPNFKDDLPIALDPKSTREVITAVRQTTKRLVIAKLSPMVTDLIPIARNALEAGADALCIGNTYPSLALDIETHRPILGNVTGGLSGPAIKPMTLRWVWELVSRLNAPIVGCGGVQSASDAVEYLLAGARLVQVGTANFYNPRAIPEIIDGIRHYLSRKGYTAVEEIIGAAHPVRDVAASTAS